LHVPNLQQTTFCSLPLVYFILPLQEGTNQYHLGVPLITASGFTLQSFADYRKRIFVAIPNAGVKQFLYI